METGEEERPRIIFKLRNDSDEFLDRLDQTEDPWTVLGESPEFRAILEENGFQIPPEPFVIERVFEVIPFGQLHELNNRSIEGLGEEHENLLRYFALRYEHFPIDESLPQLVERLLEQLRGWSQVEFAEVSATPTAATRIVPTFAENAVLLQHLAAAPRGIDAWAAWNHWGAKGAAITVADIERGWRLNHEDLPAGITPAVADRQSQHAHGTSVLGILVATAGGAGARGGQGVSHAATALPVSVRQFSLRTNAYADNLAGAIILASSLGPGNVVLVEQQLQGRYGVDALPVEAQASTDVYQAMKVATRIQDVLVVEPAGNGTQNLNNFRLRDVFVVNPAARPSRADSGALMVSAASSAVPHLRRDACNYGSRVNCFAWGDSIVTAHDVVVATGESQYDADFGFTSGASAIVAGAAAIVQSAQRAAGRPLLSALDLRAVLADLELNTPSCDGDDFPIGVMPNLCRILNFVLEDEKACPAVEACP